MSFLTNLLGRCVPHRDMLEQADGKRTEARRWPGGSAGGGSSCRACSRCWCWTPTPTMGAAARQAASQSVGRAAAAPASLTAFPGERRRRARTRVGAHAMPSRLWQDWQLPCNRSLSRQAVMQAARWAEGRRASPLQRAPRPLSGPSRRPTTRARALRSACRLHHTALLWEHQLYQRARAHATAPTETSQCGCL
jgi:hypothetical protein